MKFKFVDVDPSLMTEATAAVEAAADAVVGQILPLLDHPELTLGNVKASILMHLLMANDDGLALLAHLYETMQRAADEEVLRLSHTPVKGGLN